MDQQLAEQDYFTDHAILRDPYAYFEAVRAEGPIWTHPKSGIVFVTGFEEILEVLKNTEDFSSALAPQGPAAPLPFAPEGSDITPQIEAHRTEFMGGDLVVSLDDKPHAMSRALLSRLFTPSKLRANEAFMEDYADRMAREAVANGKVELIKTIATPFVTMVIADLLGVPEDDRQLFMDAIEEGVGAGSLNPDDLMEQNRPLVIMGSYFVGYVTDRRENPRDDVLTELSLATFPDGTVPDAMEVVRLATFLFGAGQDTSAKLLGNTMRFLVQDPALQARMRAEPGLIPSLLEEVLRLEGSTKMTARLARKDTRIGDLEVPAGTRVFLGLAAANRDPRRWEDPTALILDRPKIKEHLGFGRGAHVCIGAPLARVEVRVILEKLLAFTSSIELDESVHGPQGDRNLEYDPSFIIRGLSQLNLKLTPAKDFKAPEKPKAERKGLFGWGKKKVAPSGPYSTAETRIGVLLGDPAAKAVLDRHFPGMSEDKRISMGKGMTLRTVQKFAPDFFTIEALDAVDVELAKLPVK